MIHSRLRHIAPLVVAFTVWPAFGMAQTVPPPRQEGTAEVAFVGTTGNTSTSTFSAGGEHIVRPAAWMIRNRALVVRGSAEGLVTVESMLYGFRVERSFNRRLSAFGDYGYFQDERAGILRRNMITGGVAWQIADGPRHKLAADAGLGYLSERRVAGADVSSPTYSGGALYKLSLSETAELVADARLLGPFDNTDDWRGTHTIALTARLTTLLSLKVSNTIRYANFPPPGFKKTDTTTAVALVASFKRQ